MLLLARQLCTRAGIGIVCYWFGRPHGANAGDGREDGSHIRVAREHSGHELLPGYFQCCLLRQYTTS